MSLLTQYSSLSHFAFACLGVWLSWQLQSTAMAGYRCSWLQNVWRVGWAGTPGELKMLQRIGKQVVLGSGAGELTAGTGFHPLAWGSILRVAVAFGDFRLEYSHLWVRAGMVPWLAPGFGKLHIVSGDC